MSEHESNTPRSLEELRHTIDSIDEKIGELISERARCALEVGAIKKSASPDGAEPSTYCLLYNSDAADDLTT